MDTPIYTVHRLPLSKDVQNKYMFLSFDHKVGFYLHTEELKSE